MAWHFQGNSITKKDGQGGLERFCLKKLHSVLCGREGAGTEQPRGRGEAGLQAVAGSPVENEDSGRQSHTVCAHMKKLRDRLGFNCANSILAEPPCKYGWELRQGPDLSETQLPCL